MAKHVHVYFALYACCFGHVFEGDRHAGGAVFYTGLTAFKDIYFRLVTGQIVLK